MKRHSTEKKLELIKRIREESTHNQSLIMGRESILSDPDMERNHVSGFSFMKVRIMLTIFLFLFCVWYKNTTTSSDEFNYEELRASLQTEIDLNSIDFIGELPYTLTNADSYGLDIGTTKIEEGH